MNDKKTPMTKLMENFNLMSYKDFKEWILNTDLIQEEMKTIINAHINGQSEFDEGARRIDNDLLAEQYYINIGGKI